MVAPLALRLARFTLSFFSRFTGFTLGLFPLFAGFALGFTLPQRILSVPIRCGIRTVIVAGAVWGLWHGSQLSEQLLAFGLRIA